MNDVFCPAPWIHFATKPDGDVRICCHSRHGPTNGILRKDNNDPYNLSVDSILDSRNAQLAREVRLSIINGERHAECTRCWQEEDSGIQSRRQMFNIIYPDIREETNLISKTKEDGSIGEDIEIIDYDLRFGNFCNLKCVMCGPTDSSSWYSDYYLIEGDRFAAGDRLVHLKKEKNKVVATNSPYEWPFREEFWEDLKKQIPNIKHVFIIGGEPMLIEAHFDFLQICIDRGYAENISVQYASNITNIHQRALDLWKHFKHIRIGASIDGINQVNDYIRFPSKWRSISENLKKLEDKTLSNVIVVVTTTVSILNIYYIDDLIKWKLEQDFHKINDPNGPKPGISPHPLHAAPYLSMQVLPEDVKLKVADKLRKIYPWLEDFAQSRDYIDDKKEFVKRIKKQIESYIKLMMKEDKSGLLPAFWQFIRSLDKVRGNSIETSLPELYELIKHTEIRN
jgi:sulfatase maturation enzyme AslB (radical SAM superfamily)